MKKRISLLSLCLGLFIAACTDSSGFEDLQNFSEKEVMPRARQVTEFMMCWVMDMI